MSGLGIHESWHQVMYPWFSTEGKKVLHYLTLLKSKNIGYTPNKRNIFKAFSMPVDKIKVLILGQDPYPEPGFATGLAFAVPEGNRRPALDIIKDELFYYCNDITVDLRFDSTLEHWHSQGVLMLNAYLTTQEWTTKAHKKLWESFTEQIIQFLSVRKDPIIFVGFGKVALTLLYKILDVEKNIVIESIHPSADTHTKEFYFRKSGIFKKIDNKLLELGKEEISWLLPEEIDYLPY